MAKVQTQEYLRGYADGYAEGWEGGLRSLTGAWTALSNAVGQVFTELVYGLRNLLRRLL